jgi:hypothetical protein
MAFLGPDDILVLEKEKDTVQRIVNGKLLPSSVLTVDVASQVERFMCGIAASKSDSRTVPESLLSIATRVVVFLNFKMFESFTYISSTRILLSKDKRLLN